MPIETAPSSKPVLVFIPQADQPSNLPVGQEVIAYQTDPAPPLKQTWRHARGPERGVQAGWPTHWQPLPAAPLAAIRSPA